MNAFIALKQIFLLLSFIALVFSQSLVQPVPSPSIDESLRVFITLVVRESILLLLFSEEGESPLVKWL